MKNQTRIDKETGIPRPEEDWLSLVCVNRWSVCSVVMTWLLFEELDG